MKKIRDSKVVSVRISQTDLTLLGIQAKNIGKRTSVASLIRTAVEQYVKDKS